MINHARTLLLNLRGGAADESVPGEHLVPSAYRPLPLSSTLKSIRRCLFGETPDRALLNYRGNQYMALLHATELVEYVTDLDRRVTYTCEDVNLFLPTLYRPVCGTLGGTQRNLTWSGNAVAPDELGISRFSSTLQLVGTTLTVRPVSPAGTAYDIELIFDSELSEPVAIDGSGYQVSVPNESGGQWSLEVYNRPQRDLGIILEQLRHLGAPLLTALFGARLVEPYKTFSNLVNRNTQLAYQLGGFLLAVIYRMEELRSGNVVASTIAGDVPVAALEG